jgi:hypothetical protein
VVEMSELIANLLTVSAVTLLAAIKSFLREIS